jgi:hypothetical protein
MRWGRRRGLRRTPGQLQYDVDVRVVVLHPAAPGLRRLGRDLTLKVWGQLFGADGYTDRTQILDRNGTVGGRGLGRSSPERLGDSV